MAHGSHGIRCALTKVLPWAQSQERLHSEVGGGSASTAAARDALQQARHRRDERALEQDEENYFNEDDDEEERPSTSGRGTSNGGRGSSPLGLLPLVDYDDDDDADDGNAPRQDGFAGEHMVTSGQQALRASMVVSAMSPLYAGSVACTT